MGRPIITLTTDFGVEGSYVAQMKGVILSINPDACLADISHGVRPQDVRGGARMLAEATPFFPPGTIHVAVIDPGVGTDRAIVYAELGDQRYVAPDNGLLSGLAAREAPSRIVALTRPEFWRPRVAPTFHGRDIMAPVAARLSLGLEPDALGEPHPRLMLLPLSEALVLADKIEGEVVSVDSFGNLVTNITGEMLDGAPRDENVTVRCDDHETQGIFDTYADQPAMTLIALVNSSNRLELAIVDDSAKIMLGVGEGTKVTVAW